jgi:hypothetical protein
VTGDECVSCICTSRPATISLLLSVLVRELAVLMRRIETALDSRIYMEVKSDALGRVMKSAY